MVFPNGSMLGRYRVEGVLGQGQTGIVYRGFDTTIERTVAIKSLRPGREGGLEPGSKQMAALLDEAKLIGQLNHAHIAAVYDMGFFSDAPFFVMEYVEGQTLKAALQEKHGFSPRQILDFIVMIARALHYVHQRGILHGDIKPANIMVTSQRTPKIMDFGVSRRSLTGKPSTWSLVGEELVSGTPGYLAPEQLTADQIDARADVFSVGVIAYEWLAGRKPFWGNTVDETLNAVVAGRFPRLGEIKGFDGALAQVIERALATAPDERFASADALADALEVYEDQFETRTASSPRRASVSKSQKFPRLVPGSMYFADFTKEERAAVLQLSHQDRYEPGEVIVKEGTGGSTMYVVVEGLVSVRKSAGPELVEINKIRPGECFGEMAVISQMPRSATIVALEPTLVIAISGAVLRLSNPGLCLKLYRNIAALLSERLRELGQEVVSLRGAQASKVSIEERGRS
jgi:serine/threonine-protein kinase